MPINIKHAVTIQHNYCMQFDRPIIASGARGLMVGISKLLLSYYGTIQDGATKVDSNDISGLDIKTLGWRVTKQGQLNKGAAVRMTLAREGDNYYLAAVMFDRLGDVARRDSCVLKCKTRYMDNEEVALAESKFIASGKLEDCTLFMQFFGDPFTIQSPGTGEYGLLANADANDSNQS